MTKLNDTQAVLLSSASQRADGSLLPLPASLASGTRTARSLAGLLTRGLAKERETNVAEAVHRTDGDLRLGLFITSAGETAIGVERAGDVDEQEPLPEPAAATAAPEPAQASPRQTKAALVLGLLQRDGGVTLPDLIAATGWLPHTTRAALTGLRKKGHKVVRGKRDGVTCYSVDTTAAAAASDTADVAGARGGPGQGWRRGARASPPCRRRICAKSGPG